MLPVSDDFIFDNDNVTNSIQMSTEGTTAFAGERIDLAGASTVNSLSIYRNHRGKKIILYFKTITT